MNIKLVYLYIKNINRPLENMEFTFINDFKIQYKPDELKIMIEKNDGTIQNFWGENINSIDVVIGRNGSGKSTILDLLAQNRMNRDQIFNDDKNNVEWFAIYHVNDDVFIVEGANFQILPVIGKQDGIAREYSMVFSYDSVRSKFKYIEDIQSYPSEKISTNTTLDNSLVYIYDTASIPTKSWTKNNTRRFDDNSSCSFKDTT